MGTQATPRLMAVASHGDPHSDMLLLWRLCTALSELSIASVAVLDGTATESASNPGLADMLRTGSPPSMDADNDSRWRVIASAEGLNQLYCNSSSAPPLTLLAKLLRKHAVVIVYAQAEVLGTLLAGSGVEPLLAVCAQHASRISAYQALKRMLLNAHLRPTITAMVQGPLREARAAGQLLSAGLQSCALQFLGYQLNALTLSMDTDTPSPDMIELVARLFERAQPLPSQNWLTAGSH